MNPEAKKKIAIDAAREVIKEWCAEDEIEIDDDARVSTVDAGMWVEAWVFVRHAETDDAPDTEKESA
jgi:hypothetical protein